VSVSKIEFCGFDSHQGYMISIKRNIETKFGIVEAEFNLEDNHWVGVVDKDNCAAVIGGDTFEEAEGKLIKAWEMMVIFNKIYESNPHKDKVEKELLGKFFSRDWWKLHKN
jgi:predicted RNase H-like HicB family nuclease